MSFPIVNGIDMVTADDKSSKPTAVVSGFRSGFANATILRKDDAVTDGPEGRKWERIPGLTNSEDFRGVD